MCLENNRYNDKREREREREIESKRPINDVFALSLFLFPL